MRAETEFDLLVCALDSALVSALDSELERRPKGWRIVHRTLDILWMDTFPTAS